MKNIKTFGKTDVGMVRERNEDNYTIFEYKDMSVLCVADGMGGHTNGQLASWTVVKTIKGYFDNNKGKEPVEELVESSILLSKRKLDDFTHTLPPNASMGTTCTMGVIQRDILSGSNSYKVSMGHVGDSKLYQISGDDIVQRSVDHTMLQKMIDANALTPEEIENYPHKNIIYKSIGTGKDLDFDPVVEFNIQKGDMLLLCSDGLSGYLSPEELLNILKGTKNMKAAAQYMINLAKYRGGDDNITIALAEAGNFKRDKNLKLNKIPVVKRGKLKGKRQSKLPFILILLTLLIALGAALFFVLKNDLTIGDITGEKQKLEVRSQKPEEEQKSSEENVGAGLPDPSVNQGAVGANGDSPKSVAENPSSDKKKEEEKKDKEKKKTEKQKQEVRSKESGEKKGKKEENNEDEDNS